MRQLLHVIRIRVRPVAGACAPAGRRDLPPHRRPASPVRAMNRPIRRLAAAVVMAALAVVIPVLPAGAAGTGGNGAFGLTPVPDSSGRSAPYFTMAVAAGHSATATALISNLGSATEELKVSRVTGITATNGGSAFSRAFTRCSGVGCWVTGLPARVTLPVGAGEKLTFRVSVPGRDTTWPVPGRHHGGTRSPAAAGEHRPERKIAGTGDHHPADHGRRGGHRGIAVPAADAPGHSWRIRASHRAYRPAQRQGGQHRADVHPWRRPGVLTVARPSGIRST